MLISNSEIVKTVTIPVKVIIKFLIVAIFFIYIGIDALNYYKQVPIYYDEYLYVNRARFFDLYRNFEWTNKAYSGYFSYDSLKLPEYLFGLSLNMNGHTDINDYLKNKHFNDDFGKSDILPRWYSDALIKNKSINLLPLNIQDRLEPLLISRQTSLLLYISSLILIFLIGYLINGYVLGIIPVIILYNNQIFKDMMLRVLQEPVFVFFLLLHLLLALIYIRKLNRGRSNIYLLLLLGFVAGLSISSKITSGINMIYLVTAVFFIYWRKFGFREKTLKEVIKISIIYLSFAYLIFLILNPFALYSPIKNTIFIFDHTLRIHYLYLHKPESLANFSARFVAVYNRILSPSGNFINFSTAINFRGIFVIIGIDIIFFVLGLYSLFREMLEKNVNSIVFLFWIILVFVTISLLIPYDWDRYYLPLIVVTAMIQGKFLNNVLNSILLYVGRNAFLSTCLSWLL